MGDLENGVLGKENVAGDNGNESSKNEIDVIRYALDHVDQEIFVFRPGGELVYTKVPSTGKSDWNLRMDVRSDINIRVLEQENSAS
mgnify:CR=1 FL=1